MYTLHSAAWWSYLILLAIIALLISFFCRRFRLCIASQNQFKLNNDGKQWYLFSYRSKLFILLSCLPSGLKFFSLKKRKYWKWTMHTCFKNDCKRRKHTFFRFSALIKIKFFPSTEFISRFSLRLSCFVVIVFRLVFVFVYTVVVFVCCCYLSCVCQVLNCLVQMNWSKLIDLIKNTKKCHR